VNEGCDDTTLPLVSNARCKVVQAKEAFLTLTGNGLCMSHPIRFWPIQVRPSMSFCFKLTTDVCEGGGKRDMLQVKCYHCQGMGHIARKLAREGTKCIIISILKIIVDNKIIIITCIIINK
jgi:hypothetical protein